MRYVVPSDAEAPWETLPAILAGRRRDVNQLRAALYDGDLPAVQRVGYLMQVAGDAYGLREIPQIGAALESAARSGDVAAAYALTTRLESYLSHV